MFQYSSEQTHFTLKNGKPTKVTEKVMITNGEGTKTVIKFHNGKKAVQTHPLTQEELKNIQNRKFMPGLFRPCLDGCDKQLGLPLENTPRANKSRKRLQKRKTKRTMKKHSK
jgi:hypothetical protein